ncbi:MAG TPA: beta-propeller fold lactonase family protein [Bryobacteraceae bacterium]|jgi:6-phosphogluconolactonase (cycloisomerase 2 family)|nr:beta-propeller fold lactonase family protein [Bryobacteraceae bacterium]
MSKNSHSLSRRDTLVLALGALASDAVTAQQRVRRTVLYAAVGAELLEYDVDLGACTLTRRGALTVPANVQEAWASPSRKFLYVAWSNGGASYLPADGGAGPAGSRHGISAYRTDAASGILTQHGQPVSLPSRPIYITTDMDGTHVISAHNIPSNLTVHRILPDGTVGEEVKQTGKLDFGIYGHQVRMDPSNQTVILVTRGNAPTATKPEDPGALKLFGYNNGVLSNRQTIAPNKGFNYQIRHLDFHPSGKWDYATLERQNQLHVYRRSPDGTLSERPIFAKATVAARFGNQEGQTASSIHAHPNGRFVYVANRASGTVEFEGKRVFAEGENTIAVFSINQDTGEPTLIQTADTRGFQPRTFAIDATGTLLVAANQSSGLVRQASGVQTIPARLTAFRISDDGKLTFAHQYDFETGGSRSLFWTGIVNLA